MDRRHTLAALPALAAAAAASAPGLADDDPAARIAEAFVYGFAVHDLARTRWNATQNPANPRARRSTRRTTCAACSTIARAP